MQGGTHGSAEQADATGDGPERSLLGAVGPGRVFLIREGSKSVDIKQRLRLGAGAGDSHDEHKTEAATIR